MHKILVVDDEESMRALCGRILGSMGEEVLSAASVKEALELVNGLSSLDLLVSDMRLADGCGLDVAGAVLKKFPSAGIMIITAYPGMESDAAVFAALGISSGDILPKPFTVQEFEMIVSAKLSGAGRRPSQSADGG